VERVGEEVERVEKEVRRVGEEVPAFAGMTVEVARVGEEVRWGWVGVMGEIRIYPPPNSPQKLFYCAICII
jgi:hypothetical protein